MTDTSAQTHTEHEDFAWTINVGDHAKRADSPTYRRSRAMMISAVQQATSEPWFFGEPPYQDHHGGGVWVKPDGDPILYLLPAGIEWSAQFCADPVKVERLRRRAELLVAAFENTEPWYRELGMTDDDLAILHTPITDADGVAAWTDSLWNASVPLPAAAHTGTLPKGAGYHHYPKPIVDIEMFKHDDFTLFTTDEAGHQVAVAPVAPRGSGKGDVAVLYADPGSPLAAAHHRAHHAGEQLILPADHPIAKQAFAQQGDAHLPA